jgi:hypothetical protein
MNWTGISRVGHPTLSAGSTAWVRTGGTPPYPQHHFTLEHGAVHPVSYGCGLRFEDDRLKSRH